MKRTVKICACIHEISPLNPVRNAKNAIAEIEKNKESSADLYVLPPLFLTGGELGSLLGSENLISMCKTELEGIATHFAKEKITILAGVPNKDGFFQLALLTNGRIKYDYSGLLSFDVQGNRCTAAAGGEKGFARSAEIVTENTDVFILCDYAPAVAGVDRIIESDILSFSRTLGISCYFLRGGRSDTSFPDVYRAAVGYCRDGNSVTFLKGADAYNACASLGGVLSEQTSSPVIDLPNIKPFTHAIEVQKHPFIPLGEREDLYCLDLFDLQCISLASRLHNLSLENLVIAVSGGLDSCLALMVCVGAMQKLGLSNNNITALIMPGFGTSDKTLENARALCDTLGGVTVREIDIRPAVESTFAAIGHDINTHDVVYENAQARQRTAVALNVTNQVNGIMVGTGDLSEEALGFSTYGGDQLASYNVNVCIPKSLIRVMLPIISTTETFAPIGLIVQSILDTPVSPELLPLGEENEIVQKTEDILAPYELLDFFLYCFIAAKLSRSRTLDLAGKHFGNAYTPEYLSKKLDLFYKRFVTGQFKRNCAPDAARITTIHLLQGGTHFPSDMSPSIFSKL